MICVFLEVVDGVSGESHTMETFLPGIPRVGETVRINYGHHLDGEWTVKRVIYTYTGVEPIPPIIRLDT